MNTRFRIPLAFTLLEVILSLAILAAAAAMIGELISVAGQSAADSEAETRAQLLATSLMNEMISGKTKITEQSRESLEVEDTTPWVYSVSLEQAKLSSLISVEIVVEQDLEEQFRPTKYRLIRWLPKSLTSSEEDSSPDTSEGDDD